MHLTCPACGAVASLEAMAADEEAREAMAALAALPAPVARAAMGYLGLFRPARSRLSWGKAGRLLRELGALVAAGAVRHGPGAPRPCPPEVWAAAMAQVVEQRDTLQRPLRSHGYLEAVAHGLADQAAARAARERAAVPPSRPVGESPPMTPCKRCGGAGELGEDPPGRWRGRCRGCGLATRAEGAREAALIWWIQGVEESP